VGRGASRLGSGGAACRVGPVKGGMHFYRGSGTGAAKYFEEGHGRAEAYYSEGHQSAVQVGTWRDGERLASAVLAGRGELETWVEGRDLATGEVKGFIRPGGPERAPLRFVEVVVNNPKSLSVVATQDPVVAAALERVMARQADEVCRYLSRVAVTRTGRRGAQVEQGGLEVETARVTHLTSREGDPHRHVHLMLSARVKAPDGTWRGLHSVALRQHIGAINALGHRVLVTDKALHQALASRGYSLSADGEVDQARAAVALMSKRAALVDASQARLEAAWRAAHPGQEPSRRAMQGWHHQAWEETRRPKPRVKEGPEELAERVRAELVEAGFDFTPGRYRGPGLVVAAPSVAQVDRDEVAAQVVEALSAARSAWSGAELTAATEKALVRTGVVGDAQAISELAEDLRARAEGRCTPVLESDDKVPSAMSRHLTSAAVVDADMALNLGLAALAAQDGQPDARAAQLAHEAGLDASQAQAAAAVAGAGGLEVVVGPAGTGKTAMLAAAKAALDAQGRPLVVLAPTRQAAQVAAQELGVPATSVSKLLYDYGWRWDELGRYTGPVPVPSGQPFPPAGPPGPGAGGGPTPSGPVPSGLVLPAGSVVVVDEAGLLSVGQAVALTEVVREAGAALRLVGDPRQLGAVGRGGVMETAVRWAPGGEVTLSQVHRFLRLETDPDGLPVTVPDVAWAQVCQQLREGTEPAGVAQALFERGAVVVHPSRGEAVAALAAQAAREAKNEGALALTVATNADAAELNGAARALRVAAGEVDDQAVAPGMDGARIGAGDRVVTRRNDSALAVANRQSWTVKVVRDDGSLVVQDRQRQVELPAEYVAGAVQLGYAVTDYGNQGVTATRSLTWVNEATSAGGLYVGASRGRWQNTVHVVADGPEEAKDVLAAAVRRDRSDRGLDAARARAEAEALRPTPKRQGGPVAVPEGWRSAAELQQALRKVDIILARELARAAPVPVMDEDVWRAEAEADRAIAAQGRATAAWYEAEAARAVARRDEALETAQAEFFQARGDARTIAAGPGRFGRRAERVREAEGRRAETAERWRGYCSQLPGERWPDETVAQVATSAVDARLAHQLRFCEAEINKASHAARLAEERIAQRDSRREKALAHNQLSATRGQELEASAQVSLAELVEQRRAMTAGLAPEEVRAIDAARDAQLEHARAVVVARGEHSRRAQQLPRGWDRGLDRDGPGLGL
jgi:exodeoxyribonuclease V alpha subunit